jgi:hypothetical protein
MVQINKATVEEALGIFSVEFFLVRNAQETYT